MVFNGSTRDFQSFGLGSNPGTRSNVEIDQWKIDMKLFRVI